MKLGFGLYKNSLNSDNYEFVKQIGATHVVAHLTNYFSGSNPEISSGNENGWGVCDKEPIWDEELLGNLMNTILGNLSNLGNRKNRKFEKITFRFAINFNQF